MTALGITLPLHIRQLDEAFAVDDAAGRSVAYVYFCDEEQRRVLLKRVTKEQARQIAQATARALTEAAGQHSRRPAT